MTGYHKGFSSSGKVKIIHRYCPKPVSELLIYYLWLIVPFECKITEFLNESADLISHSAFIWPERPRPRQEQQSTSPIRKRLRRNTTIPLNLHVETDDSSLLPINDLPLSGRYNTWTSGQLSALIKREFSLKLGQELGINLWRHFIIGLINEFFKKHGANSDGADQWSSDDGDNEDDVADLQAGHSTMTASHVYARKLDELIGQTADKRRAFRGVSTWLHGFFGFSRLPYTETDSIESRRKANAKRWRKLAKIDLHLHLRVNFGTNAVFLPGQEDGLNMIRSGKTPLLIIMATGSGKSLFFQFLPFLEPGLLIILFLLFVALREDQIRRFDELRLSARPWDPDRSNIEADILLVSMESVNERFLDFLTRQIH